MSEKLAGYGVVTGVDTKANVSTAGGAGIVRAVANEEETFLVTAVGYDGIPWAFHAQRAVMQWK
jgi:hypothetical protein